MVETARQQPTAARMSKRVIAAYHRALGQSQTQAAQAANCSRQSVSNWELSGERSYREAFDEARATILREGWGEAWHTLRDKLRSADEHVQVAAARAIVNAVGQEQPQTHIHESGESPFEVVVTKRIVEEED